MAGSVLDVSGLSVDFATLRGPLRVLDGVDFSLDEGEILGLVEKFGKFPDPLKTLKIFGSAENF